MNRCKALFKRRRSSRSKSSCWSPSVTCLSSLLLGIIRILLLRPRLVDLSLITSNASSTTFSIKGIIISTELSNVVKVSWLR